MVRFASHFVQLRPFERLISFSIVGLAIAMVTSVGGCVQPPTLCKSALPQLQWSVIEGVSTSVLTARSHLTPIKAWARERRA